MGAPTSALAAGLEGLVVAAILLVLGWLVISMVTARFGLDGPTCWGLSTAGLGMFVTVVMIVHILTGGLIFRVVWVVPALIGGTIVTLGALRLRAWTAAGSPRPHMRTAVLMLGLVLAGVAIWGTPVFRSFPINFGADTAMHSAYSSELLKGETTPSAPITGRIPNQYPWLFHAALALTARVTPGEHATDGLGPLEFTLMGGTLLALFALGRSISQRLAGGVGVALLGGLTGGFGYFISLGPALVFSPRINPTRFWGDFLFVRSFNPSFYQLIPPFPRDLAFAFLVCALTLAIAGFRSRSVPLLTVAGATIGMAGLSNGEAFFVGMAVFFLLALIPMGMSRTRAMAALFGSGVAVYLLWLVPQLISYVQLGGYVNLTIVSLVSLPLWATIASWGMITPLALVGLPLWLRRSVTDPGARVLAVLLAVCVAALLIATLLPNLLGTALLALLRAHRYWPLLAFALSVYAGLGAVWLMDRMKPTWLKAVAWTVIFGLCVPSPILAGIAVQKRMAPRGLIPVAASGNPHSLLNIVAKRPGACVVAAPKAPGRRVWTYSGYRMVMYWVGVPHPGNRARIRWADIYHHIVPEAQRIEDNRTLVHGNVPHRKWEALVHKYGVDAVVTPDYLVPRGIGLPSKGIRANDAPFTVFRTGDCGS